MSEVDKLLLLQDQCKNDATYWLALADAYEEDGHEIPFSRNLVGHYYLKACNHKPKKASYSLRKKAYQTTFDWRKSVLPTISNQSGHRLTYDLFELLWNKYPKNQACFESPREDSEICEFDTEKEAMDAAASCVLDYLYMLSTNLIKTKS